MVCRVIERRRPSWLAECKLYAVELKSTPHDTQQICAALFHLPTQTAVASNLSTSQWRVTRRASSALRAFNAKRSRRL